MSISFTSTRDDGGLSAGAKDGVGRYLRAARQARGLTAEQVADQLRLNQDIIKALERDDYAALPDRVFVTGYIRKYARLFELNPGPLLDTYRTAAERSAAGLPRRRRRILDHLTLGLVSLVILALVGVATYLWRQGRQADIGKETIGAEEMEWETAMATWPETAPESGLEATGDGETDAEPVAGGEAGDEGTAGEPVGSREGDSGGTGTAGEPATAVTAKTVVVTFQGPCWVDIRESEGDYRLIGIMKQGDRHVLGGKPPYAIKLGNKKVVQITVDGVPFDLSPVSRSVVARFTLDPEALP